ncbi:terpene synthase [Akanthomyces lecanii RCEF 1005]|uniref:Terpene synthase n=1 Tax=Akanthomyces lecanii RCEF 1005 TaxID=1081108 RepID=A0A168F2D8_CORDF|nr:terpene synthase [Akanthomyces lecanii RCEF 1005]
MNDQALLQKPSLLRSPRQTTVLLPDMFQSFLRYKPLINPNYETVKADSEDWINRVCAFDSKMARKISKCDFSYFCAIAAPEAPPERFRTLCDWGNWVFPFDDMFDNGRLRDLPEDSRLVMESLMMPLLGQNSQEEKRLHIVRAHDSVVERVLSSTTAGVQRRFAFAMQGYCHGALMQVNDRLGNRLPSLEEMLALRHESSGCRPLYPLVEYAHDLQLPDEVFDDPCIQELEDLGVDMVAISNDILSYQKEQAEGVPHNMVIVCQLRGLSAQQAFDTVGKLLEGCYRRWEEVEGIVPHWGAEVDAEVQRYIDGIKAVVKANLNWRAGRIRD